MNWFLVTTCIGVVLIILVLCTLDNKGTPLQTNKTENPTYEVSLLFKQNECGIYRFYDKFQWRYFVTCPGGTMSNYTAGKSTYENDVPTGV